MPQENRVPPSPPGASPRAVSPPFYRVEQRSADGTARHFVVHTQSPKFVVEFERTSAGAADAGPAAGTDGGAKTRQRPVLRRVCVPNSWSGDYHHCARQLGAAADFFAATDEPEA